ncbi:FAD-dependent oxidoreductase [Sphingomonas sp.]|uniref:FAD-dependent oxidoreductase n=1 Tax=Sphingomonas sp. TaxID=28214 RepID=UPI002D7FD2B3|nr:FAD-dependent oxidoreductase [Sphingomonas sp.]HEU0043515.1 FAD-dependent oxidoreductase [Sphingomonas sp.]
MNATLARALVVGGGIGGMSAAIALRQRGVAVDLVDIDPEWRVYGAGITITGPTLRAFNRLGLIDAIAREGYFSDRVEFYSADGILISTLDSPVLEPGIPAAGGILRPVLHRIMSERTVADGTQVRLGVTVDGFVEDDDGVHVTFTDGTSGRYDAVIGADGSHSRLRARLFPGAPKLEFTGQGCWRILAPRPANVTCSQIWFGPECKLGMNPCSPDSMYMFATTHMPGNPHVAEDQLLHGMRDILAPFGGDVAAVRAGLGPDSQPNYRPLFAMTLPAPWNIGRIGLIGDAVHPTTPHLATGAGLSVEDGIVLAEELMAADSVAEGWVRFTARRLERARLVVENSVQIGRFEQEGGRDSDVRDLMRLTTQALAEPV